ncbi:hypothetical protein M145_2244 [Bacteroides fragilis str. 34-F-2 |nr:hypothetical protein M145_2244 [Bacteroides fragilis str. 34-F-2 \
MLEMEDYIFTLKISVLFYPLFQSLREAIFIISVPKII